MSEEDVVKLPDDNCILPSEVVAAITDSDAYPETSSYSKSTEFIDFERYGKPFTQVITTFKPHKPRVHNGREIILVCGAGGQAALTGKTLVDMGYKNVSNVGAIGDWEKNGGPMVKL